MLSYVQTFSSHFHGETPLSFSWASAFVSCEEVLMSADEKMASKTMRSGKPLHDIAGDVSLRVWCCKLSLQEQLK